MVEGEEINLTVNGFNTQNLKNVFINQNYSFITNPADDLYTFTFDNAGSNIQSSIKFTLKERWTDIYLLVTAFIILLATVPTGIVLIIMGIRKHLLLFIH